MFSYLQRAALPAQMTEFVCLLQTRLGGEKVFLKITKEYEFTFLHLTPWNSVALKKKKKFFDSNQY